MKGKNMTFDDMYKEITDYKTNVATSDVCSQLKKIIDEKGMDIFKDYEALRNAIQNSELSNLKQERLILVFSCKGVADFVLNIRSNLNLVDVDNVIHNVLNRTGLSYRTTVSIVTDILCACGMHFSIEYGPVLRDQSVEYRLHALMPSEIAAVETKKTKDLFKTFCNKYSDGGETQKRDSDAADVINAIKRLCAAGIADGFFLLGQCYLYGKCNTAVDHSLGMNYLKLASDQGSNEASALLGYIYYNSESALVRNYTLAHYYYTRPGALPINMGGQSALEDIYEQKKCNTTTIVFSAIVFALTIAFVNFFHDGMFSGSSRLAIGIVAIVMSLIAVVFAVLSHIRAKFNGIRWLIAIQFFVFAIYAFILVLA